MQTKKQLRLPYFIVLFLSLWCSCSNIPDYLGNSTVSLPDFITVWDTTKISSGSSKINQITLPLKSEGTYDFDVIWGDGSSDHITHYNDAAVTHTYIIL